MQTHRMRVVIPEDRRATIDFPETIRSGPAELIVLIPSRDESLEKPQVPAEGSGRMAALVADLRQDSRPFRQLSPEERGARLERIMGIGRGLMSTSEEFASRKSDEVELEDRKFAR